jgi:hypothetical protein
MTCCDVFLRLTHPFSIVSLPRTSLGIHPWNISWNTFRQRWAPFSGIWCERILIRRVYPVEDWIGSLLGFLLTARQTTTF